MGLSPKIYHPFRRRYTLLLGRFRCKKGTGLLGRTARNRAFEAVTGKRLRRVLVEVVLPALKEVGVARLKGGPMTAKLCKMAIWPVRCILWPSAYSRCRGAHPMLQKKSPTLHPNTHCVTRLKLRVAALGLLLAR
jgi:hypothetical protein